MGTLNSCLKSKSLYRDGNENFSVGTATMQGFRLNQEDAHKYTFSLKNHPSYALFGVFDGHGGEKASHFLEANILDTLNNLEKLDDENIQNALMLLDKKFVSEENSNIREQGSTCVFCLVKKSKNKLNKTSLKKNRFSKIFKIFPKFTI
ncbi:protein phosphatase 2c [Bonamia ostreae]|uniref:Protein phosphatase 2c n=1 Tax=Bonamia ostreae TaxID=126728 RepID=A0ABV2AFM1_9EUKA